MLRTQLLLGAVVIAVVLTGSGEALAHGGQFRGPGGALPPGLRDPTDPPPPAPPPSPTPTTPTTPDSPPPTDGPTTPPNIPAGVPSTPRTQPAMPGNPRSPRGRAASLTAEDWEFWYSYQSGSLERVKEHLYRTVGTQSVLGAVGRSSGNTSDDLQAIRVAVREHAIPTILWALDPKNAKHDDVESAAYLALAKMARTPQHIERLKPGLALGKERRGILTQEAAALSFGLLRRTRAAEQFRAMELDGVRSFLFQVVANDEYKLRTRGMAILSLGLLGDQPTGHDTDHAAQLQAAQQTTARLFELLAGRRTKVDLEVGTMLAIGMQLPASLTTDQRELLRTYVSRKRFRGREINPITRAHATTALARLGEPSDAVRLLRLLSSRATNRLVSRSAAIGLGLLARRVDPETRIEIGKELVRSMRRARDRSTRNFARISMAYVVIADVKQGRGSVLTETRIAEQLIEDADDASGGERAFAALALGLASRAIGPRADDVATGSFRSSALEALSRGLDKHGNPREKAAFALAYGLGGDVTATGQLADLVGTEKLPDIVRGYAAIGLGHLGGARESTRNAIRKALQSRSSETLQTLCARALGLLGDRKAAPLIVKALRRAKTQSTKGQLVLALARVGTAGAVEPLATMVKSSHEQDLTRALAVAGLGIISDLEFTPTLSRLSTDINYRAGVDLTHEALSIL